MNIFADMKSENDFFAASLDKTLKAVFRSVLIHVAPDGNMFFVASDQSELELRNRPNLAEVHEKCREEVRDAWATILKTNPDHGIVLTDDYNPLEYYDAANRERIRRQLAMNMRRIEADAGH